MNKILRLFFLLLSALFSGRSFAQCATDPVPSNLFLADAIGICSVSVTAPHAFDCNNSDIIGTTISPLTYTIVGTYTITWNYNDGSNAVTQDQLVVVNPAPTPIISTTGGDTTFCNGNNLKLSSNSSTGNFWSGGGITSTNPSITVDIADTYSLTVTTNGCSATATKKILVDDSVPVKPVITALSSTTFCEGIGVSLLSSSSFNNEWIVGSPGNQLFGATDSILAVTDSVFIMSANTYRVRVRNNCGSSISDEKEVIVKPLQAKIRVVGSTSICPGGSALLVANGPTGNTWTGGSNNDSLLARSAKNYILAVNNGCGPASYDTVTITQKELPAKPYLAPFDSACSNALQVTLTGGIPAGGTYSGNGVFGETYSPVGAGLIGGLLGGLLGGGLGGLPGSGLPGAGASSNDGDLITYTYTDTITGCSNSISEKIYLKDCPATDIGENTSTLSVNLFPNPSTGIINLHISDKIGGQLFIEVNDVLGNTIFTEAISKNTVDFTQAINLSELAKGIYYLKITLGDAIATKKVVVQ